MPPASSTPPITNRAIAAPFRPPLRTCASCEASTAPPSACSGVTVSTRREPAHAAAQVVSATTAAGITSTGCSTEYSTPAMPSADSAIRIPTHDSRVPPMRPSAAPITPTMRPCRAISPRCDRAEAPMRRIKAMRRVRPATTVAKVFAVTIDAT
jgi:hypothetical protein